MIGGFSRSIFHAQPGQLLASLVIDALFLFLFGPTSGWATAVYIIFLPGFDLVSAVASFWNYVKDYRAGKLN